MPINPSWTRWIVASLTKHFNDSLTAGGLYMYAENMDRRTDQLQDYAEFRYTGPYIKELSKGYFQVDVEVDVLVVSKVNDKNIYTPEVDVGVVLAAFTPDIAVFKLGNRPGDDPNEMLECLRLDPVDGCVTVNNFGLVKDQVRLRQASVEAIYRMNITT